MRMKCFAWPAKSIEQVQAPSEIAGNQDQGFTYGVMLLAGIISSGVLAAR